MQDHADYHGLGCYLVLETNGRSWPNKIEDANDNEMLIETIELIREGSRSRRKRGKP